MPRMFFFSNDEQRKEVQKQCTCTAYSFKVYGSLISGRFEVDICTRSQMLSVGRH